MLVISGIIAVSLFVAGAPELHHDALAYHNYGLWVAEHGLLQFDFPRTYAYPLFIAGCLLYAAHAFGVGDVQALDVGTAREVIFASQWLAYVLACLYASRRIRELSGQCALGLLTFAAMALNPWLLIRTTEVLTDLLSAAAVLLAFAASLPGPALPNTRSSGGQIAASDDRRMPRRAAFAFGCAACSAVLRPSNVSIVVATALAWLLRPREGLIRRRSLPIWCLLGLLIPFLPQLWLNYLNHGRAHPLVVGSERVYSLQLKLGLTHLKYGTLAAPEQLGLVYHNPYLPVGAESPLEFLRLAPGGYALTLAVHGFALLDPDLPFTYIADLRPWYRWPSSILGYLVVFLGVFGIALTLRPALRARGLCRLRFAAVATIIYCTAIFLVYLPTAVEVRYGSPIYLLLTPWVAYSLLAITDIIKKRRWRSLGALAVTAAVLATGSAQVSGWIERQSPLLQ